MSIQNQEIASESTSVNIKTKNQEFHEALTGKGGPLQSGFVPHVGSASESGDKAILESILQGSVQKQKVPKNKKEENSEPAKPKTLLEIADDYIQECLTKSGDARKLSIALGTLEYSGDLSSQMLEVSAKLEECYRKFRPMVEQKSQDVKAFKKIFDVVNAKLAWFVKAEARPSLITVETRNP